MKKHLGKLPLGILVVCFAVLLYPREVILAPGAKFTVYYEDGRIGKNVEVSRSWNSYMGDGWKANLSVTDENGKVIFKPAKGRVSLIYQGTLIVIAPFGHFYPGTAGSFKARDPQNHKIWERIDFRDYNCCPSEVVMKMQESELESTFIFGDLVSE
ncbi:MAG: hypothetical protein M3209_15780 [Acidobacteriota bacterium]|nr:hypothetical protein [Acidobacteriota bacterium]